MKQIVLEQYRAKIDQLIDLMPIQRPKEGWIRTFRKALGMSSPQLATRMGVSKSQMSQMERMETEDRITLKQLRRVADCLECDLIYLLKPRVSAENMVKKRARLKAKKIVQKTDIQMKLEAQQLTQKRLDGQLNFEVNRLMKEMPRDLWDE